jgi:hypothetical protein
MDWYTIVSLAFNAVVGILAAVLGAKWIDISGKWGVAVAKMEAMKKFMDTLRDALADEKVTAEEAKAIYDAGRAILA